jgi:outer membrane protein
MKIFATYQNNPGAFITYYNRISLAATSKILLCSVICIINVSVLEAQNKIWSVDDCIKYALEQNIQILKAKVGNSISEQSLLLAKSSRFPSASGSARENFNWGNQVNQTTGKTVFTGTNGTSFSASSNVILFNAFKIQNNIRKSQTDFEAGIYSVEVIKESVSLSVLNAYLQVLYAEEQVKNSVNQINSTAEQVRLAEERMKLGAIANSDYLVVKSLMATENTTLAAAQNQLAINRVTLMQLMELPQTDDFEIAKPNLDSIVDIKLNPNPIDVYKTALQIKPEVKNAELNKKSSQLSVELAKANYFPGISMNAGLSTNFNDAKKTSFGSQLNNNISPAVGLSVSVPIYSNRQVKTSVEIAKMNTTNADLDEQNTKNILRKSIEQACLDVKSAQIEYEATLLQYQAAKEAFDVASEKYFQGLLNSIDLLVQKTSFIAAESNLLQSKYRLIFSYKILDFYSGIPLSL